MGASLALLLDRLQLYLPGTWIANVVNENEEIWPHAFHCFKWSCDWLTASFAIKTFIQHMILACYIDGSIVTILFWDVTIIFLLFWYVLYRLFMNFTIISFLYVNGLLTSIFIFLGCPKILSVYFFKLSISQSDIASDHMASYESKESEAVSNKKSKAAIDGFRSELFHDLSANYILVW